MFVLHIEIGKPSALLFGRPWECSTNFQLRSLEKSNLQVPQVMVPDSITVGTWAVGYDMFDLCIQVLWSFQSTSLGLQIGGRWQANHRKCKRWIFCIFQNIPRSRREKSTRVHAVFLGEKSKIASYFGYLAVIFRCIF